MITHLTEEMLLQSCKCALNQSGYCYVKQGGIVEKYHS